MLRLIALAIIGLAVTYAQMPHHCLVHPELSFRSNQFNHNFSTFREYATEYDGREQRVAFLEQERKGTGVQRVWVIFLYHEHVAFEYNIVTKQCKKFHLDHPFFPWGVPPEAKFEAEFYIGGPGEDVEAIEWSARDNHSEHSWHGQFSRMNCYPMRFHEHSNHNNHSLTTQIYDLLEGIINPDQFIPPPECGHHLQAEPFTDTVLELMGIFWH